MALTPEQQQEAAYKAALQHYEEFVVLTKDAYMLAARLRNGGAWGLTDWSRRIEEVAIEMEKFKATLAEIVEKKKRGE